MTPLLLLALLPLDLSAGTPLATANGLKIEATLDGRRVGARLTNVSSNPLEVLVGYTCGGPEPFQAIVDGAARSFVTGSIVCTGNAMVFEKIAPGRHRDVPSETIILDGNAHRVAVRYSVERADYMPHRWAGTIISVPIEIGVPQLDVQLRMAPLFGRDFDPLVVDVVHIWRGSTPMRFLTAWRGVCGRPVDTLIVDGVAHGLVEITTACRGPAAPVPEVLRPGQRYVTRGKLVLPPGLHQIRAHYGVDAATAAIVDKDDNVGTWTGAVESPEVEVAITAH